MKKWFYLALAAAVLTLAVSCGGSKSSGPGAAAKNYMEAVAAGDIDTFLDGTYFGADLTAKEIETTKDLWRMVLKNGTEADEKGGVASIEILSEEIAADGQRAEVVFKRTYGNGEVQDVPLTMVLIDGRWLMDSDQQ